MLDNTSGISLDDQGALLTHNGGVAVVDTIVAFTKSLTNMLLVHDTNKSAHKLVHHKGTHVEAVALLEDLTFQIKVLRPGKVFVRADGAWIRADMVTRIDVRKRWTAFTMRGGFEIAVAGDEANQAACVAAVTDEIRYAVAQQATG